MSIPKVSIPGIENFTVHQVKVGTIKINYATAGHGKNLIFIHGFTNNWTGFIPLASILKNQFKVILIDLPGYGDSGRLETYTTLIMVQYLKKFIDKLQLKDYCLIGHSMGSFIVSQFYQLYPLAAQKIIYIGAVFKKNNKVVRLKIGRKFLQLASKNPTLETITKKLVDGRLYAYAVAKYINMYHFDKKLIDQYGLLGKWKMAKEAYTQMGSDVTGLDNDKLMAHNLIPMLLIYGQHDKICSLAHAKKCLRGLGTYQFATIKDSGHVVTIEQPAAVATAITKFVN